MIEIFPVYSEKLKNERNIRVYLPASYHDGEKRYPVLYMHDGQNVFNDQEAIGGLSLRLEKYLHENWLELIVVAIDQISSERKDEYCPWPNGDYSRKLLGDEILPFGGKGEAYSGFLVEELKPVIDQKYRTRKNRAAMAGISMGAQITLYTACRYPGVFSDLILLSGAFYANQEELENFLGAADLSGIESCYMDCGTAEAGEGTTISREFLTSNRSIYNLVKQHVATATFKALEGNEHHYRDFQQRVPALFSFLSTIGKQGELKRKYGDRAGWKRLIRREFRQLSVTEENFTGDITLLTMLEVAEPAFFNYPNQQVCVVGNGYSWLQHFPKGEQFSLTTVFDERGQTVQWYIDICLQNGNDKGRPFMDDLYLDIIRLPNGDLIQKDADELEEALANGFITPEMYGLARQEADRINELLAKGEFELIHKTSEHRKLLLEQ